MAIERLTDIPFPATAHRPGRTPRPPAAGRHCAAAAGSGPPLSEENWRGHRAYLYGIDLFNHHYWWEAHEAWEGLWRQAPRDSPRAHFLQGLIQVAAMLIKGEQGRRRGAEQLRQKALAHLGVARTAGGAVYMGLDLAAFMARLGDRERPPRLLRIEVAPPAGR